MDFRISVIFIVVSHLQDYAVVFAMYGGRMGGWTGTGMGMMGTPSMRPFPPGGMIPQVTMVPQVPMVGVQWAPPMVRPTYPMVRPTYPMMVGVNPMMGAVNLMSGVGGTMPGVGGAMPGVGGATMSGIPMASSGAGMGPGDVPMPYGWPEITAEDWTEKMKNHRNDPEMDYQLTMINNEFLRDRQLVEESKLHNPITDKHLTELNNSFLDHYFKKQRKSRSSTGNPAPKRRTRGPDTSTPSSSASD